MSQTTRTYEEAQALNMSVVADHFHNEAPETIDKAIATYGDEIVWEGPARGVVLRDPAEIKEMYLGIYQTLKMHSHTQLHRFATDEWVFDDCIYVGTIVDDKMRNLPFPLGTKVSMRLAHAFQLRDGKIIRENAYEIWRRSDDPTVNDDIPADAVVTIFE